MAFTAGEKIEISKIIGMTPTILAAHLVSLGASLTAEIETAVRAEIASWNSGTGADNTFFTPTESNRGLNLNSRDAKYAVKENICILLEIPGVYGASGLGTIQVCS